MTRTVDRTNDPRITKAQERREQRLERERAAMLRAVLSTPEGRFVIGDLIRQTATLHSAYDEDPHRVFYNVGRQDVGRRLQAFAVAVGHELYDLMELEYRERDRRTDAEIDSLYLSQESDT